MDTQNKSRIESDESRQRGRNRGNDEQLAETVEQFGAAINAHVYRKLERLTQQEEKHQPVIHNKRSERRW